MRISHLIGKLSSMLEQHGDVDVLLNPWDSDGPYESHSVVFKEVEEDRDFPKEYNMPKGFQYVEVR